MRCPNPVLLAAALLGASAALAQPGTSERTTPTGRSVTATGQTKPPVGGGAGALTPASQEQMLKAQRAAQARDKAWDAKMNKTMGSICKGC